MVEATRAVVIVEYEGLYASKLRGLRDGRIRKLRCS